MKMGSMMRSLIDRSRARDVRDDSGVALVAAVAVAIIGLALCLVVVTQAMVVTTDSHRDRVRTSEIHSAEGVLDAALFDLETTLACDVRTERVGQGSSEVEVQLAYSYYNASGPLTTCSGNVIQGTPTGVVLTATATPVNPMPGIAPERTIEAGVELAPGISVRYEAAIFAGNSLSTNNMTNVSSADPMQVPHVRAEGNGVHYQCHAGITVKGDLTVVRGSATFQHANCRVEGDVWVRDNFEVKSPHGDGQPNIGGDVTVRTGNMNYTNANYKIGGNVVVAGNITGSNSSTATAKSFCAANRAPCSENLLGGYAEVLGLPVVDWTPSAWIAPAADSGLSPFTIRSKADFHNSYIAQASATQQWQKDQITGNCEVAQWKWYGANSGVFDFNGGAANKTPEVYDLRTCQFMAQNMTFKLYADTAIFANSFSVNNQTKFVSGDGQPHTIYLIVPNGGPAGGTTAECSPRGTYSPGNVTFHTPVTIATPIDTFIYTPCDVKYQNPGLTRGQVYARNIEISTNNGFEFVPVSVPGRVDSTAVSTPSAYEVRVLYKQERRN